VVAGRDPDGSRYEEAWRYLFLAYRPVVAAYFGRRAPDAVTADEWTDEFLAAWVEGSLDRADPGRGGFRRYLFTALRHFAGRSGKAARRRGLRALLGLGVREAGPADPPDESAEDAARAFDRDWARQVLALALEKLRRYQELRRAQDPRSRPFDLVQAYYLPPPGGARPSQRELAARFELTEKAVERQLEHARGKLRAWLLDEVRDTVADEDEVAAEVGVLLEHGRDVLGALDLE